MPAPPGPRPVDDAPEGSAACHRRLAGGGGSIAVAVITVSDTRTAADDASGAYLVRAVAADGHRLASHRRCRDEAAAVAAALDAALAEGARVVLLTGGTGIARRDVTADVVAARLERSLPGFGELFRMLSHAEIGSAAMLSRAVAGTIGGAFVAALPGSTAAVRLAWERLIAPELGHVVWELDR